MIEIEPTNHTAAVAGAWASLGAVPVDGWLTFHHITSGFAFNVTWAVTAIVFFILPFYFLVLGHGSESFSRTWFLNKSESSRHWITTKRLLIWFLTACVIASVWGALLSFVSG